jgi:hypothetical protein
MARDEIVSTSVRTWVTGLNRLAIQHISAVADVTVEVFRLFLRNPFNGRSTLRTVRRPDMLDEFPHLVRLFRSAVGPGRIDELISLLNALSKNSDRIQRAVIVWLDLLEVLVQQTERRHGAAPGRGKLKAAEVKQAMKYLLRTRRFSLPNLSPALQTLMVDYVVDVAIDVIVLQTNRYDLWEVETKPSSGRRIWDAIQQTLLTAGMAVANLAARFLLWLRDLLQVPPALSPQLKAALDAIERESDVECEQDLLVEMSRIFIWLGTHRAELVQSTELVFGAVQEAESLFRLTGPEKKRLAKDMIWRVLEDMNFIQRDGLLGALMDSAIDLLIEVSVHFFHKRGAFEHRRLPAPSGRF